MLDLLNNISDPFVLDEIAIPFFRTLALALKVAFLGFCSRRQLLDFEILLLAFIIHNLEAGLARIL